MKFRSVLILLVVISVSAASGFAFLGNSEDKAFAEFSVSNMTCGSCVRNIETALKQVPGVDEVEVSIATARSRVSFLPSRVDALKIAESISSAGYPAKIGYVLTAEEYRAARKEESRLANKFVAKIGERLIPRKDFQAAVNLQRKRSGSRTSEQNLMRSTWQSLVQNEILLEAADQRGTVVQDGEVQAEIQKMRTSMTNFDKLMQIRYGSVETFAEKLKADMTIQRLIDETVLTGEEGPAERDQKLQDWYADLAARTEIRILDPQLKAAMAQGSSGCGGSCCG